MDITKLQNTESGQVVIIGNGPSMNDYKGAKFACPIIGINLSYEYWPEQDYYVTVAYDRLADIAAGKVSARKAIFSCLHKAHAVPESVRDRIIWVDMSLPDLYADASVKKQLIFSPDLSKPTYKTFGGMFAIQVALFLGFTELYLIGFDGGSTHFRRDHRDGRIPPEYHNACLQQVYEWLKKSPRIKVHNSSMRSKIIWFGREEPPILERAKEQ